MNAPGTNLDSLIANIWAEHSSTKKMAGVVTELRRATDLSWNSAYTALSEWRRANDPTYKPRAYAPRRAPKTKQAEQETAAPLGRIEHGNYRRLVALLKAGVSVYLWGPAGSGKTTALQWAAEELGRESEIDTLDPSTFRSMVQGFRTADGGIAHTSFSRCWEDGKVYIAEELDSAPGHVQNLFNSALANGRAPLAWGNRDRADGFVFAGNGNTPGRPTAAFPERRPMAAAFKDRLYYLFWDLDQRIEQHIGGLPVDAPETREQRTCTKQEWTQWVLKIRAWATENAPTLQITPRATIVGIKALELGETPEEAADGLVFRGADKGLKKKALAACPLPSRIVSKPAEKSLEERSGVTEASTPTPHPKKPEAAKAQPETPSAPARRSRRRSAPYATGYWVTGTKFEDRKTRHRLRTHKGRWDPVNERWSIPADVPKLFLAGLKAAGCTVVPY